MNTTPDISKLPKWAQEWIKQLERERTNAVNALNRFMDSQTKTKVTVERTLTDDAPYFIQSDQVRFSLSTGFIDVRITDEDELRLMGQHGLLILPHVTNVIQIKHRP